MAKLGIHKRGSGIEKLYGSSVSHHKPKDLNKGDQIGQHPMTSPIHPNLASLAGGPTGPASTEAAQSSVPTDGGDTSGMSSTPSMSSDGSSMSSDGSSAGGMGLKKGGRVHYAEGSKWIQGAIKHPGALRASLHVKAGEKITAKKLSAAAKKPGVMGKRARLAQTLKGFKK